MKTPRRPQYGFTLIELLIVVAIIGIIAAVALPNLMNALNTAKQKRTMADLRSIGTALEMYQKDHSFYPILADSTVRAARPFLRLYNSSITPVDAWNMDFYYSSAGSDYSLISFGKNRTQDLPYTNGQTHDFNADIVFTQGTFVQWPEGTQAH